MLHQDKHQDKSVNIEEKLYSAILNDSADQVDFWLTAGANVHAIDSKGRTPLQYAVEIRRWNCVKVFLKHVKEKIPGEILREMILEGPEDIAKLMIQKGCELEENYSYKTGYHALHTAIYKKKFTVVEALLEHKVNPSLKTTVTSHNFKEVSPLELAVETNQPYMIRLLLKFASDATSSTYFGKKSLVSYAAENKFWDCVKVLVGASVLKDDYGLALKYATDYNNTSIACLLIESKADPHSSYGISNGFRTLHCAIEKGNCEIVASLLEHKANPNAKAQLTQSNAKDTTSLEVAIKNNQIRALQLLLDAGVDTSIKMTNSTSALIYAASLQY
ncbi:MAG TPA: ankyrin repeat domain-containing protein, partial [Gammaproteobacteria bacterium]|nr:ankyrin repeat domain-containing protein [Gammaproteobacteria bacterium]